MLKVVWEQCFKNSFDKALKRFPQEESNVKKHIDTLCQNSNQGITVPGNYPQVNKIRIALSEYKLSKSAGLRLFFTVIGSMIYPLFIYKKGDFKESDVQKATKKNLKSIVKSHLRKE